MHTDKPFVSIQDARGLQGKRVLLRASLNVPLVNNEVRNSFRIDRALDTIQFLCETGARVIVIAHIGRDPKDTLKPVFTRMQKEVEMKWCDAVVGQVVDDAITSLENGEILMLENLRTQSGEIENDDAFARRIAAYGDIYVNDAFSVSHREHASIVCVPKYLPAYAGILFEKEYDNLSLSINPTPPSLFVLGGAKFETKMPLVEEYIKKYDHVFVGGALVNDIFRAKGYEIGASMISNVDLTNSPLIKNKKLLLPIDVTVYGPNGKEVREVSNVSPDETILDVGPRTIEMLKTYIDGAETVLWNGPLGDYERGFCEHTEAFAQLLADAPGFSVIGGGDTVAAIESLELYDTYNFVSTAGGAMLKFLELGTLPGIEVLSEESSPIT